MAENKFEAIEKKYQLLDNPLYQNAITIGPDPLARIKRRRELQDMIRTTLKQWNIQFNWGAGANWWKEVPVETYNDINNWLTPQRKEELLREKIVHQSFINQFLQGLQQSIQRFGGILSWPLLAPFKNAMKKGLQDEGYSTSGNLQDIAKRFFDNIVKKRSEKPDNSEKFETADPVTASMIIQTIIQFFSMIQKNAQNVKEEEMAKIAALDGANAQELINREIANTSTQNNTANNQSGSKFDFTSLMGILMVISVLVIVYKLVSK